MNHLYVTHPKLDRKKFGAAECDERRFGIAVFIALFEQYMMTLKEAVRIGVEADLASTPEFPQRQLRLTKWLGESTIESLNIKSSSFGDLLAAVCGSPERVQYLLPPGKDKPTMSYKQVAEEIVKQICPGSTRRISAPFFTKSGTQAMMRTGMSILRRWYPERTSDSFNPWLIDTLAMTLRGLEVRVIPWHPLGSTGGAVWNSWADIQNSSLYQMLGPEVETMQQSNQDPMEAAIRAALLSSREEDPSADWTVRDFMISDIKKLLDKRILPSFNFGGQDSYVSESYEWVQRNWNHNKDSHRYFLLAGVVLGKLSSHLGVDADEMQELITHLKTLKSLETPQICRAAEERADRMQWTPIKKSTLNDVDRVAMGSIVLAMCLMDERSPLRRHMVEEQKQKENGGEDSKKRPTKASALGKLWNSHHSERRAAANNGIQYNSCCIGSKGITPFNLLRVKMVEGNGSFKNPSYPTHYWTLTEDQYSQKMETLKSILTSDDEYKVYDAIQAIAGQEGAQKLRGKGEFAYRGRMFKRVSTDPDNPGPLKRLKRASSHHAD